MKIGRPLGVVRLSPRVLRPSPQFRPSPRFRLSLQFVRLPIAVAILGCGAAFSAAASAADAPVAHPATPTTDPMVQPDKHPSLKACNQQADRKSLTGKDRSVYVRDCQADKKPASN